MADFLIFFEEGKKKLEIADHILNQTFNLVKDPKVLLAVLEDIIQAYEYLVSSIVYYDLNKKIIPSVLNTFESRFNMFCLKSVEVHKINQDVVREIKMLKEIFNIHKKSAMEFKKNEKLVICNENFSIKTLSYDNMRNFLVRAKEFMAFTEKLISM